MSIFPGLISALLYGLFAVMTRCPAALEFSSIRSTLLQNKARSIHPFLSSSQLRAVRIYAPSSSKAVEMGVREWPGKDRGNSWSDRASDRSGKKPTAIRYVLEGVGTVTDESTGNVFKVGPGTMIEVDDNGEGEDGTDLTWRLTDKSVAGKAENVSSGFLILSPIYDDFRGLAKVALLLMFVAYVGLTWSM
mmetsp:Transcript_32791/g.75458  ORF Transcript_32791/g.75458 Transcript_32791/m.75458 type:complete len:191 (-) Transcript_32791:303-875(-)